MVVGIASIGGIGRVIGGMVVEGRGVVGGLRRIRQNSVEYRGYKVAVPRKIFRLVRNDELCGVIVYSYSPPRLLWKTTNASAHVDSGNEPTA